MTPSLDRRKFLGGTAAASLTTVLATAPSAAAAEEPLRAAVLEYRDPWTSATGLAELLRRAGVEVVALDPAVAPGDLGVDLIAFGTFTNNESTYPSYVATHSNALRTFVADGGVVLEMAQSDQFGAAVAYLPDDMAAVRADPDHTNAHPVAAEHPLVAGLRRGADGRVFTDRASGVPVSWETLVEWRGMRVLLGCSTTGVPPCLLEGAHGAGRFLVSSLTVDKCFGADGAPTQPAVAVDDSVTFFAAVAGYVRSVRSGNAPAVVPTPMPTEAAAGPMVGHVETRRARVWLRPGKDHRHLSTWSIELTSARAPEKRASATLSPDNDHTLVFDLDRLQPGTRYDFSIVPADDAGELAPLTGSFATAPLDGRPTVVTMGLGSCAPSSPNTIWDRIVAEGCDSFVMLGDTPYIDSTDLRLARTKHREFLMQPELARMVRSMPVWGTWDDHDFGGNDVHGDLLGKRNTRAAFVDYRANASYGHDGQGRQQTGRGAAEGIYTSFRRGPIEVILLDPRWFSRTEPSWADPDQPTCLGRVQWEWLKRTLKASTATFKVIASGMIWDDKTNSEKDDWGTYSYEREAIFDFIKAERIPGVVLTSGDIHVSRALNYGPRVGYDLWQFITSPLHDRTIPSLNVPHPSLVHSAVEPHVFLKLVADTTVQPATLTATWVNREGRRVFEVRTDSAQLGH